MRFPIPAKKTAGPHEPASLYDFSLGDDELDDDRRSGIEDVSSRNREGRRRYGRRVARLQHSVNVKIVVRIRRRKSGRGNAGIGGEGRGRDRERGSGARPGAHGGGESPAVDIGLHDRHNGHPLSLESVDSPIPEPERAYLQKKLRRNDLGGPLDDGQYNGGPGINCASPGIDRESCGLDSV